MIRAGRAQVRGRREALAPLNGMPSGGGYRRFGVQDWDPAKGRHLDEAAVRPRPTGGAATGAHNPENARRRAARQERVAALARLLSDGKTVPEAAKALGITEKTGYDYAREIRRAEGAS